MNAPIERRPDVSRPVDITVSPSAPARPEPPRPAGYVAAPPVASDLGATPRVTEVGGRFRDGIEWEVMPVPDHDKTVEVLSRGMVGQHGAIKDLARFDAELRSSLEGSPEGPLGFLLFVGPSGVGKTHLAGEFAENLANEPGGREAMMTINSAEFSQQHVVAKLIGSPPGYVDSDNPHNPERRGIPALLSQQNLDAHRIKFTTNDGREQSATVVLLDEIEKGHPHLWNMLLSMTDKNATLDMANGTRSSFRDVLFILTSNIGNRAAEARRTELEIQGATPKVIQEEMQRVFEEKLREVLPHELVGRVDNLIIFRNLTTGQINDLIGLRSQGIEKTLAARGVRLAVEFTPEAKQWLIDHGGYDPTTGARAMNHLIDRVVYGQLRRTHDALQKEDGRGLDGKRILYDIDPETGSIKPYYAELLPVGVYKSLQRQLHGEDPIANFLLARAHYIKAGVPTDQIDYDPKLLNEIEEGFKGFLRRDAYALVDLEIDMLVKAGLHDKEFWQNLAGLTLPQEIYLNLRGCLVNKQVSFDQQRADFLRMRADYINSGVVTARRIDNDPKLLRSMVRGYQGWLRDGKVEEYEKERNLLVASGMGTRAGWDKRVGYDPTKPRQ